MEMMQQFVPLPQTWHVKVTFPSETFIMCMHVSYEQQFYAMKCVNRMNMSECVI